MIQSSQEFWRRYSFTSDQTINVATSADMAAKAVTRESESRCPCLICRRRTFGMVWPDDPSHLVYLSLDGRVRWA